MKPRKSIEEEAMFGMLWFCIVPLCVLGVVSVGLLAVAGVYYVVTGHAL